MGVVEEDGVTEEGGVGAAEGTADDAEDESEEEEEEEEEEDDDDDEDEGTGNENLLRVRRGG